MTETAPLQNQNCGAYDLGVKTTQLGYQIKCCIDEASGECHSHLSLEGEG